MKMNKNEEKAKKTGKTEKAKKTSTSEISPISSCHMIRIITIDMTTRRREPP